MAEEALPIVRGYQYSLRMAVTGGDAPVFPDGAKLRAQVREFAGSPRLIAEMTFQNGGLRRVSNDTIDLVMNEAATRAIGNSSAIIEFSRTDMIPFTYLYIMLRVPVMKDQILSPVVVTVKPSVAVSLSTPPAFFGGLAGVLSGAGAAVASLVSLAGSLLSGSGLGAGSAVGTIRTLLGATVSGSAAGVCLALATLASQSAIMMSGAAIGTAASVAVLSSAVAMEPTSAYALDFANASYNGPSGAVSDPVAAGLLSHSRASAITVPNLAGVYSTFASGVKAINDAGWWLRGETRANLIKNNSMVGAAVGAPGTDPTTWVRGGLPSGLTASIVATGAADPDKGLPYTDYRVQGTPASTANFAVQFGATAGITTALNERHMFSVWLAIVGGAFPIESGSSIRLQATYAGASNQTLGAAGTSTSKDKVFARDTKPRRLKHASQALSSNAVAPGIMKPSAAMTLKANTAYDFTLRIIAPQVELVAEANADASLPILTTTAAVTHQADVVTASGTLLAMLQGPAAGVQLRTRGMRGSGIDFRKTYSMIAANGNINLLSRTDKGELATDLGGSARTYRSWRTQFDWRQDHRVQWGGGKVAVASSSPADKAESAASIPAITSVAFTLDGCLARLDVDNGFKADLAAYTAQTADVICYGATSGGIVGAASVIADGGTAMVVGGWRDVQPGGMASGGLGAVDASVSVFSDAFGGMALDYAHWCNEYTGNGVPDNKSIQSAHALLFFDQLIRKYQINQRWSKGLQSVAKSGARISAFTTKKGQRFSAAECIDCGYEGDLMALAGVNFRVGREAQDANNAYNGNRGAEAYSSVSAGTAEHNFTPTTGGGSAAFLAVDPWKTPGDPNSGLIAGVQSYPVGTTGAADGAIQAYNFRITATRAANRVSFYPNGAADCLPFSEYELLGRYMGALAAAGFTAVSIDAVTGSTNYNLGLFMLLNGVGNIYDINSNNGFSTDTFGSNWGEGWARIMTAGGIANPTANYAVATDAEREVFWKWQERYIRGLFYYLGESGDPRIPAVIAADAKTFGLDPSYYLDPHENDQFNWMPQLYVREARALVGRMVLEASDVQAADGSAPRSLNVIGQLSYAIDSHHVRRYAVFKDGKWFTVCEGNIFVVVGGNKRAPIAMEYIMPQAAECSNLLVTFASSARHTGFGALRMEMAHMGMSEAAGLMAMQRVRSGIEVDYSVLRPKLQARGLVVDQAN